MPDRDDIPVLAIVGTSGSGKTTLIERLVSELASRGVSVATVKHHPTATEADTPGTDSWRHARAGARIAMLATPHALAVVERVEREPTLEELARRAREADILLAEGYKRSASARIEVLGDTDASTSAPAPVSAPEDLTALVADIAPPPGYEDVPLFLRDDIHGIADLIERVFLGASPAPARHAPSATPAASEEGAHAD